MKQYEWTWLCLYANRDGVHASVTLKGNGEPWLQDIARQISKTFRDAHDGDFCQRDEALWINGKREGAPTSSVRRA